MSNKGKQMKNEFGDKNEFTRRLIFEAKYVSLTGVYIATNTMPTIKDSNLHMANFIDLCKGRLPKYNKNVHDRTILNQNQWILLGNPIIGNPNGSGEQIIITNLYHKKLAELKELILSINETNHRFGERISITQRMYNSIKKVKESTHVIPQKMYDFEGTYHQDLKTTKEKKAFYTALLHGNTKLLKEYINHIYKNSFVEKNKDEPLNKIMSFNVNRKEKLEDIVGIRFLEVDSTRKKSSTYDYTDGIEGCGGRLVLCTINNEKLETNKNIAILSNDEQIMLEEFRKGQIIVNNEDERKMLNKYRRRQNIIETPEGIYIYSDQLTKKLNQ